MDVRKKLVDVFTHLGEHIQNRGEYGICYTSDFAEAVEEALKMLKNSVTVQEWISVEDRLPDETQDEYVLVVCAYYDKIKVETRKMWHLDACVTHWMPLPAAPED